MARIPDEIIEQLKREVAVEQVVAAAGVKLSRRGNDLHGVCPFHEDTDPSLVVTPKKGLWRCFGCDKGGTVIDWVMAKEGKSFREAVEVLLSEHFSDVDLDSSASEAAVDPFTESEISMWIEASDEEALSLAAHYYRDRMSI